MKGLFDRMVKQNFAAAGLGEGPSNLIIKPELIEVFTDLSGPEVGPLVVYLQAYTCFLSSQVKILINHQP